jgi:hypothetical protein
MWRLPEEIKILFHQHLSVPRSMELNVPILTQICLFFLFELRVSIWKNTCLIDCRDVSRCLFKAEFKQYL